MPWALLKEKGTPLESKFRAFLHLFSHPDFFFKGKIPDPSIWSMIPGSDLTQGLRTLKQIALLPARARMTGTTHICSLKNADGFTLLFSMCKCVYKLCVYFCNLMFLT